METFAITWLLIGLFVYGMAVISLEGEFKMPNMIFSSVFWPITLVAFAIFWWNLKKEGR